MNHKNQVTVFLALAISLVLVLPVSNVLESLMHRKSQQESLSQTLSEVFGQERLFSTDAIQGLMRYQAWQRLGLSLDQKKVVAGRDGFLFLGNEYNSVFDKATGRFPIDQDGIDRWAEGLVSLRQWYEEQGIPFVMAMAPNKHSIYYDKLPERATPISRTVTDYLLEAASEKGVDVLDLRQPLHAARVDKLLYYQTDTHWNKRAAGIAYQNIIRFASENTGIGLVSAPVDVVPGQMGPGDLARLLKIDRFLSPDVEEDPQYKSQPGPGCLGELQMSQAGLGECEPSSRPIAVLQGAGQYTRTQQALNPLRVLVLCDSFCNAQTGLMTQTFSTVWFVHWLRADPSELAAFARAIAPDLVIYQVVERNLFHEKLVAELPQ